jgi:uncharacterized protein with HEPN domain
MRNDRERLNDILSVIEQIEKYFDKERYLNDEPYRHGMVNYLTIIGEASKALSQEARAKVDEFDWKNTIRFRDRVVHRYYEIDWDVVLEILEKHIPILKKIVIDLKARID